MCGSVFRNCESLTHHRKLHEGRTTCPICLLMLNRVSDLRRHMYRIHQLDRSQVAALLPPP